MVLIAPDLSMLLIEIPIALIFCYLNSQLEIMLLLHRNFGWGLTLRLGSSLTKALEMLSLGEHCSSLF